jgi:hypothetical protein
MQLLVEFSLTRLISSALMNFLYPYTGCFTQLDTFESQNFRSKFLFVWYLFICFGDIAYLLKVLNCQPKLTFFIISNAFSPLNFFSITNFFSFTKNLVHHVTSAKSNEKNYDL